MITTPFINVLADAYGIKITCTMDDLAATYRFRIENEDHKYYDLVFPYTPEDALDLQTMKTFICDALISCIYKWKLSENELFCLEGDAKND